MLSFPKQRWQCIAGPGYFLVCQLCFIISFILLPPVSAETWLLLHFLLLSVFAFLLHFPDAGNSHPFICLYTHVASYLLLTWDPHLEARQPWRQSLSQVVLCLNYPAVPFEQHLPFQAFQFIP